MLLLQIKKACGMVMSHAVSSQAAVVPAEGALLSSLWMGTWKRRTSAVLWKSCESMRPMIWQVTSPSSVQFSCWQ